MVDGAGGVSGKVPCDTLAAAGITVVGKSPAHPAAIVACDGAVQAKTGALALVLRLKAIVDGHLFWGELHQLTVV